MQFQKSFLNSIQENAMVNIFVNGDTRPELSKFEDYLKALTNVPCFNWIRTYQENNFQFHFSDDSVTLKSDQGPGKNE